MIHKVKNSKRIDVCRGYRVHIDFNIDFEQFQFGLDCRREQEEKLHLLMVDPHIPAGAKLY